MSDIVDLDDRRRDKLAALERAQRPIQAELPLQGGGGGGTFEPMVAIKDYVDIADEAVETRLAAKMDRLATKGTVWAAVATILGVLLGVLAFGGDRFDAGLGLADQRVAQAQRDRAQDATIRNMDGKLDRIIAAQARR